MTMTTPPTTELPTLASQPDTTPSGLPVMLLSTGPSDGPGMVVKFECICPDFARGEQLFQMFAAALAAAAMPNGAPYGKSELESGPWGATNAIGATNPTVTPGSAGPNREPLTYRDAARELGVSERTVFTHVKNKTLRSFKIGNAVRIPRDAIDEFIAHGGTSSKECS